MRAHEFISLITEHVNDKLFYTGYEKKKPILSGKYILKASAGYVGYGAKPDFKSSQFRIVAETNKGEQIGWVNFENKNDKLEALDLSIQPAHRRQGIATEMYKFARELGNDIAPSRLQTGMGKLFWNRDHSRDLNENFADGRNPQDKGDSKRYKVPTKASISTLRKIAKQGGRRGQLAHWMANMKSGKAKKESLDPNIDSAPAMSEAEIDPHGWGSTPMGVDVDYFGFQVLMRPSTFLKLASPLTDSGVNAEVTKYMHDGGKIAPAVLHILDPIAWEEGNLKDDARIVSHEGRNRMTQWIKLHGDDPVPVNLFFRNANRRRFITDKMIKRLNRGVFSERGSYVVGPLFTV